MIIHQFFEVGRCSPGSMLFLNSYHSAFYNFFNVITGNVVVNTNISHDVTSNQVATNFIYKAFTIRL